MIYALSSEMPEGITNCGINLESRWDEDDPTLESFWKNETWNVLTADQQHLPRLSRSIYNKLRIILFKSWFLLEFFGKAMIKNLLIENSLIEGVKDCQRKLLAKLVLGLDVGHCWWGTRNATSKTYLILRVMIFLTFDPLRVNWHGIIIDITVL